MEVKKYGYIDSLRGIAILLVVLVHTGYNLDNTMHFFPQGVINTIFYCQYGVQLFFMVSAYTLTISYHSRLGEEHQTRNFFLRRYFRIAPLFYLGIVLNLLLKEDISSFSWIKLLSSLTFTSTLFGEPNHDGYVPGGWTISVEFIFYMLLPLICTKIKNINSSLIFVLLTLLVSASYQPLVDRLGIGEEFRISYFSILYQLPIFGLGILAYWFVHQKEKKIEASTALLIAATAAIFCYLSFPLNFAFSIMFFFLLIAVYLHPYKLLVNKALTRIGVVSFSMYVIHFIVIHLMNTTGVATIVTIPNLSLSVLYFIFIYIVVVAITFIISNITYRFVEVPGQNLGRKIIKNLSKQ